MMNGSVSDAGGYDGRWSLDCGVSATPHMAHGLGFFWSLGLRVEV